VVPSAADGNREVKERAEAGILRGILLALGSKIGTRLFRNTVGVAYVGRIVEKSNGSITLAPYRVVTHGLAPGSSDLIGWQAYEIQPRDVGRRFAVFLAVEVKAAQGTLEPEQSAFLDALERSGGIAICARSEDEARKLLDEKLRGAV
jgi:VRR-NUC domain